MSKIPHDSQPISDGGGRVSKPWRAYLQSLESVADGEARTQIGEIIKRLGSTDGTVDGIPNTDEADKAAIIGLRSIQVIGTLADGEVKIALRGDASLPMSNAFYGMGVDAAPGFHPVSEAVAANEGVMQTVDDEGVSTFALEDVAPADGGTLQRTQFDDKGRRSHEAPATTTHLPEGDNLYFTAERAQDAVALMIAAGSHSGVTFHYDDASGAMNVTAEGGGSGAPAAAISLPASENIAAGSLVNVWSDAGVARARKADATATGFECRGFVADAVAEGAIAEVLSSGVITGLFGMTTEKPQYLSKIAGLRTELAPSAAGNVVQCVGYALSETELAFEIHTAIIRK